jgi:hypothetical protein
VSWPLPLNGLRAPRPGLTPRLRRGLALALALGLALGLGSGAPADTTTTTVPLPGGTSAAGAFTLASVYGQASSLVTLGSSNLVLAPGFLCIEAEDVGNPGDLNNDDLVNGVDLAIILSNWGICGSGACIADINRDGFVDGVDLAIVLSNWG